MATLNKRCKCGTVIPIQIKRCDECDKQRHLLYDKTNRNQESKKFYGSKEWQRVRYLVLNANPFCVVCRIPATLVDHIIPIRDGGDRLNLNNLQPMCSKCHAIKTSNERNR